MILGSGLIQAVNTFVGAYDAIPSIAAAYSTRRLLSSYTGPLLRLVADRTGYPEQDIGYTAAGDLDTAAAVSFLAGDAGYVTKWYDQSGNTRDAAQATLANMPLYVASGQNSRAVLQFAGTQYLQKTFSSALSQPYCVIASGKSTQSTGNPSMFDGSTASHQMLLFYWTTNTAWDLFGGAHMAGGAYTSAFSIFCASFAGVASTLRRNTSGIASGNAGTQNAEGITIGAQYTGSGGWVGIIAELIVSDPILDASEISAAETASNAYWSAY